MIVGMGVDIVEVPRIRAAIERFGDRFLHRLFTAAEIRYCESKANKFERFAARFAAKEAALKAIGTGLSRGISWQDVEVVREPQDGRRCRLPGRPPNLRHAWVRADRPFRSPIPS